MAQAQPPEDYEEWEGFPPDSVRFDAQTRPDSVVLLATLELAINDGRGNYLLVTSPRYEPVAAGNAPAGLAESGQWTPPHVSRTLSESANDPWRTGRIVNRALRDAIADWKPLERIGDLVQSWSCGVLRSDVEQVGSFTELKRSWGKPKGWKLYHVLRFAAETGGCEPIALADPDWRKGFFYLPIDEETFATSTRERWCPAHRRRERMFLGQPLATNLTYVAERPTDRHVWRDGAAKLSNKEFAAEYTGLLVAGDIAGYGAACQYVDEHMTAIAGDTSDSARVVRESAVDAFTRVFHEAGMPHIHNAGDGFIAGQPLGDGAGLGEALDTFLVAYWKLIERLEQFNARIRDHHEANEQAGEPRQMGSRVAFHFGTWRFGKIAGAASIAPAFDGAAIIDVARLEQSLAALTKGTQTAKDVELKGKRHTAIASQRFVEQIPDGVGGFPDLLTHLGWLDAEAKESKQRAAVFEWRLPEPPRS